MKKEKKIISVSTSVSKLGGFIPSISFSTCVCRHDAPCKGSGCYAEKGHFNTDTVQKSYKNNLEIFLEDPKDFEKQVISYLNNGEVIYKFFRWFVSGDIVNEEFFKIMIKIAKKCKQTKFLCFTKKYWIVNNYLSNGGELPKNLRVIFSGWGPGWAVDNPHDLPTTYVYFKGLENKHIPEFAIPCTGDCSHCKSCWSLQNGQSVYFKKH